MRMLLEPPEGHEQPDEFIGDVSTVTNCLSNSFHLDATQEICPTNPPVYNFDHTAFAFKRYHGCSEAAYDLGLTRSRGDDRRCVDDQDTLGSARSVPDRRRGAGVSGAQVGLLVG